MYTPAAAWGMPKITGEILNAMVRRDHPEKVTWVRPEHEPGLVAAVDGMNDLAGLAEGVARCPAPVALWSGEDDLYYNAIMRYATANGFPVITVPGEHIAALEVYGGEAARQVSDFIEGASRKIS
jgi:hypothetical protein